MRLYYYLLLNKLLVMNYNLIEAAFDNFAGIWMQHPMWLKGFIPEIVFKLDLQCGAYSAI